MYRASDEAFRRFLRRVWKHDVAPLLRDRRARQRARTARAGGKIAAAGGLLVDRLFGLKGRPFARFMTVMGSSLGAMLPDVWDWRWMREQASAEEREAIADEVARSATSLPEREALELFGLVRSSTLEELRVAWRGVALRWHPDKAGDEQARHEHQVRFVAYQAAYERLLAAYAEGRLPSE